MHMDVLTFDTTPLGQSIYSTSGLVERLTAVPLVGGKLGVECSLICFNCCIDLKNCIRHRELFIHPVNIFSPVCKQQSAAHPSEYRS